MQFFLDSGKYSIKDSADFSNTEVWIDLLESIESYTNNFLIPMNELIEKGLVLESINGKDVNNVSETQSKIKCNTKVAEIIRSKIPWLEKKL